MPGSVFNPSGRIGHDSFNYTDRLGSPKQSTVIVGRNNISEIDNYRRRNIWPTTNGDITLLNSLKYYWDAAVSYSYPTTGSSIWYDIGPGRTYINGSSAIEPSTKNPGTLAGNTVWSSDGGGSFYLDGTGDWITSFPYPISNATTRTVGIFYKTTSSAFQTLIANRVASDNGWSLIINATVSVGTRLSHFTPTTDYTLDYAGTTLTNTWYHLTYTYDRSALDAYLYVNATQVASDLTFQNDTSSAFNGVIGAGTSAFGFPFTGYIGLVYIADSVFTAANVTTMHNLFKGRFGI